MAKNDDVSNINARNLSIAQSKLLEVASVALESRGTKRISISIPVHGDRLGKPRTIVEKEH